MPKIIKLKPSEVRKNPNRFSPNKEVIIRCPLGEICGGSMSFPLTLLNLPKPATGPIEKTDKFNAQGLEGCAEINCTWAQAFILLARTQDYRAIVFIMQLRKQIGLSFVRTPFLDCYT